MGTADINLLLGRNLRRRRLDAGLSQEAFVERCGLHRTNIGAVERGERNVTLKTLARLAMALSVPPLELLREPSP